MIYMQMEQKKGIENVKNSNNKINIRKQKTKEGRRKKMRQRKREENW